MEACRNELGKLDIKAEDISRRQGDHGLKDYTPTEGLEVQLKCNGPRTLS